MVSTCQYCILLVKGCFFIIVGEGEGYGINSRPGHEFRLLRDLMTEYDPAARPVKTKSDVVFVKMGVALFQIRELVCLRRNLLIFCFMY